MDGLFSVPMFADIDLDQEPVDRPPLMSKLLLEYDFGAQALPSPPLSFTGISDNAIRSISEHSADTIEDELYKETQDQANGFEKKSQMTFDDLPKELRIRIFQLLAVTDLMKAATVLPVNRLTAMYCRYATFVYPPSAIGLSRMEEFGFRWITVEQYRCHTIL